MKILYTFLLLSLSIITANSLYAFEKYPNSKLPHQFFPGMKNHQEQLPPEFNDVKGIENRMPNNLKKKRGSVITGVYLVDSVKEFIKGGEERRSTYTYNSNSNKLTMLTETWQNGRWMNLWRGTYSYNLNGNILISLDENCYDGKWVNIGLHTYTYDSNGYLKSVLYQHWYDLHWVNLYRYSYNYDSTGNMLSELYENWGNGQWVYGSRHTNTYDSTGNMLTNLYQGWGNGQWVNLYLYTYSYDSTGNILTELYELWQNEQWVVFGRYIYNSKGNILTKIFENWEKGQWVNSSRLTSTYDSKGNMLSDFFELWQNEQWMNSKRNTYTYDSNRNLLNWLHENWENKQWVEMNDDFLFTDSKNNDYYFFAYKIEVTWKSITSVLEDKTNVSSSAYPNPLTNSATIQYNLSEPAFVRLNIYNSLGEKVSSLVNEYQTAGEQKVFLDAENYPSGMYFYRLETGMDVISKPIVVVK